MSTRDTTGPILVTGGAGFIGSHLCDRLLGDGAPRVVALDDLSTGGARNILHLEADPRFALQIQDVAEPLRWEGPLHRVYHLACPASPVHYSRDPVKTIRTAVLGTWRALELCRATGARLLVASTSEVYGDPLVHPQSEDYRGNVNPGGPRSCYDEGKRCAEALVAAYRQQHGVEARIARIFNTYGPRMVLDDGRVVTNFGGRALLGEPLEIFGDGSQTRSFCYVDDTVAGLVRLMEADGVDHPVNLGNPDERTILEVARLIRALCESPSAIVHRPLPLEDPRRRCPDIGRAQALLGWEPQVPLTVGLGRTLVDVAAQLRQRGDTLVGRLPEPGAAPVPGG